jgi:hypothetical protein
MFYHAASWSRSIEEQELCHLLLPQFETNANALDLRHLVRIADFGFIAL